MSTPGLGRVGLAGRAHHDAGGVDLVDHAGAARADRRARIARDDRLHPGAHQRRVGAHQRHRLALHVGAHQRAIRVVVLEERNQRGGDRHKLLGRNLHEVDAVGVEEHHVARMAADDQVAVQRAVVLQRRIGLGDAVFALLHRREIDDLHRHPALAHAAVRRFDEPIFVDARERRERVDEADVRAFRRLDRADAAIVRRVHVAHLEARALARQAARAKRRKTALVGDLGQRVGLVHELGKLRGAEEFAHRRRRRFGVDQVLRHHRVDLDRGHPLLDRALHAQQADAILIFHQLADRPHAAIAEVIDVVDLAAAIAQVDQRLDHRQNVRLAQHAHGVFGVEIEAHVHLDAADRRQVIALGVEEQRREHRFRAVDGRRFAGAHHAIDVEQRVLARGVLVDLQRVADIRADVDVIDVEHRQFVEARLDEGVQRLVGNLVARLGENLAGLRIIEIVGDILPVEIGVHRAQRLDAALGQLAGGARRQLLAGLDGDFAAVGVDQVDRRLEALHAVSVERHAPAVLGAGVDHLLVEGRQNLFAVHAERIEQRGHRNLAAPVDARMHDVLGVEFDVEPGAAIGNDSRGEQQLARRMALALVVIEEHAGAAVHLRDDHPLGAVDDERAVRRHERHVAHVDVLLLDVLDRLGAGLGVDVEHDQAQRHLQRRGERHAALTAFVDVVFRRLILVFDELEQRGLREIGNREHGLENGLQALVGAAAGGRVDHQKLVVRRLLNLDEVRHFRDFLDVAEDFANTLAAGECLRHIVPRYC